MFTDDIDKVLEKQTKRLKVLRGIYIIVDGITESVIDLYSHSKTIDIKGEELIRILEYLENERLIKSIGSLWGGNPQVKITHQGVIEIEVAITRPNQGTEHFVQQVIMNFFGQVGAIQTGENIATVSQNNK